MNEAPRPELSFDGHGINGPDEYRSRLATFSNVEDANRYGPLFAASPNLLAACEGLMEWSDQMGGWEAKCWDTARAAIAQAGAAPPHAQPATPAASAAAATWILLLHRGTHESVTLPGVGRLLAEDGRILAFKAHAAALSYIEDVDEDLGDNVVEIGKLELVLGTDK